MKAKQAKAIAQKGRKEQMKKALAVVEVTNRAINKMTIKRIASEMHWHQNN